MELIRLQVISIVIVEPVGFEPIARPQRQARAQLTGDRDINFLLPVDYVRVVISAGRNWRVGQNGKRIRRMSYISGKTQPIGNIKDCFFASARGVDAELKIVELDS